MPACLHAVIKAMTEQRPDRQGQSDLPILVISPYPEMQKLHLSFISFQLLHT